MISNPLLRRFLGINQIEELYQAWVAESGRELNNYYSSLYVWAALGIAFIPALSYHLQKYVTKIDLPTFAIGITACLAVLLRLRAKGEIRSVPHWKKSLKLTHTAFAIGCVPFAVILIYYPEALFQFSDSIFLRHQRRRQWSLAN